MCGLEDGIGTPESRFMISENEYGGNLLDPIHEMSDTKAKEANEEKDDVERASKLGALTGLTNGCLDGATCVCVNCFSQLMEKVVPTGALIAGSNPGIVPMELRGLNSVELSMISIYNCISFFKILPSNGTF